MGCSGGRKKEERGRRRKERVEGLHIPLLPLQYGLSLAVSALGGLGWEACEGAASEAEKPAISHI